MSDQQQFPPSGDSPFGQQQQQPPSYGQPQGQQPYGQQPYGQPPGGYGYGMQPMQQQRSSNRTCLIIVGGIVAFVIICVVCCVGAVAVAFSSDEVAVTTWFTLAADNDVTDIGLVCEGSPAEDYSAVYAGNYDNVTSVTINEFTEESSGEYYVEVTLDSDQGQDSWRGTFTMGDENGFLGLFGNCIEEIQPGLSLR